MRKFILALTVVATCVALSGCWFFDAKHNRRHYETVKRDMYLIHQDLDWILLLDQPSVNDAYYR